MATKIESTEITQPKKVFVKSEEALDEMEANGQLEPFTDYYTDDEQDAPFMPVGSIFASAIPQTDARVHLLDGSTILQTGVYETFSNLIKALVSAGQPISCTQSQFDTDVSTYGQCGKFVIDDTAGTIRLPLITEFIASNNGGQEIGIAQLDMFKSHAHSGVRRANADIGGGQSTATSSGSGDSQYITDYTGGEETRPKNIRYPYYIVLASGYKSSQVVDVDNIMNEVNGKLPLTGGTVTGNTVFDACGVRFKNASETESDILYGLYQWDDNLQISRRTTDDVFDSEAIAVTPTGVKMTGTDARPTYNGNNLALQSDIPHAYHHHIVCSGTNCHFAIELFNEWSSLSLSTISDVYHLILSGYGNSYHQASGFYHYANSTYTCREIVSVYVQGGSIRFEGKHTDSLTSHTCTIDNATLKNTVTNIKVVTTQII